MGTLSKRIPRTTRRARSLRQMQTPAERALWNILRDRRFHKLKFRRQVPVGAFIVDFYCPQHRLIIEVDGGVHDEQQEMDLWRQHKLERDGYHVLRFSNAQLSPESVLEVIDRAVSSHNNAPPLPPQGERFG